MSMSQITLGLNVMGLADAKEAAATIYNLKQGLQGLQGMAGYGSGILAPMITPTQGLAQGRTAYEEHNRQITDQAKQIRDLTQTFKQYEDQVFSVGRAYGYARDQMVAMADASKQLQGQGLREGNVANSAAYARLTGMDPVATAQQMAGFAQQGVATNQAQQQQFIAAIEGAVQRGSSGGYTVLTSSLLPILSSINQQQLARNPFGTGLAGTEQSAGILASMYASGIPGLREGGAAQLYGQVDRTLTSANSGPGEMLAFRAYQQAHPGSSYFQFQKGRQAGLQDPAFAQALLSQVHQIYGGQGKDAEDYMAAQAMGMNSTQWQAYRMTQEDAQGRPISTNPADYAAVLKRVGARKDIDTGAVGLIGRLEGSQGQDQIDAVINSYEQLSGKGYTGKRDKESVERALGQVQTGGLNNAYADKLQAAQSETANAYEDGAQKLRDYNLQMYQFNEAVAKATTTLVALSPQTFGQLGAVASIGAPIIGGAVSAGVTALSMARIRGGLGGFGGGGAATAAAPAAAAALAPAAATAAPGAAGSLIFGGAGAGGAATTTAGGGMLAGLLGPLALGGAGAIASGAGWGAGFDRLTGSQGRAGWALPAAVLSGIGATPAILGTLGIGAARHFGVGGAADDWATQHIPGFAGLFGHRAGAATSTGNGAGNAGAAQATGTPLDEWVAQEKQQTDLLTKIEAHLAAATNFDKQAQAAYGAGSSTAPRTMNAGGPVAAYVPGGGGATGGGASYVPGAGAGTGTPGQGFGEPTVDQVNAMLKGTKLEGYGAEIIKDARDAGVPVSVALAMIKQESSFNTPAQGTKNNFGGLKGKGGSGAFADFPDISSGLSAVIGNMGTSTYQGKSLADFVNTYLGGPAGGDPDAYLKNVLATIQSLGGNASPNSVPVVPGGGGGGNAGNAGSQAASNFFGGAAGKAMLGGGGGGTQQIEMVGRAEIIVKYSDGTTDRQWVTMAPASGAPFGGIINWPTRGVSS